MKFTETKLKGAYLIDLEPIGDDRGFFARAWCRKEFEAAGLDTRVSQANISFSKDKGTLRGMHWQRPPSAEIKLVRCIRGAIYDVIVDLRKDSPTFLQWIGVELTAENRRIILVPEGFAHGMQTLVDDTETYYQVSEFYAPEAEDGARPDDPAFNITWPLPVTTQSERDANWPNFDPERSAVNVTTRGD
ncbi:MAG: dTDP-4-dehydrorhamnose 3,5-epimerase [Woeseiaceae bacterium]